MERPKSPKPAKFNLTDYFMKGKPEKQKGPAKGGMRFNWKSKGTREDIGVEASTEKVDGKVSREEKAQGKVKAKAKRKAKIKPKGKDEGMEAVNCKADEPPVEEYEENNVPGREEYEDDVAYVSLTLNND